MLKQPPFKGRHFEAEIILFCVRWYLRDAFSSRDLGEMMQERGLDGDHTTISRWVQYDAPEMEKRCRPFLRETNDSWRVDETDVKVKGVWTSLYRAVDSQGKTWEFFLSSPRNARVVTVEKNAAYPQALDKRKAAGILSTGCERRPSKYLNNLIEHDHRFIKRLVKPGRGFFSFETACRTGQGDEIRNLSRKGQARGVNKGTGSKQATFIAELFGLALSREPPEGNCTSILFLSLFLQHSPFRSEFEGVCGICEWRG